MFEKELFIGLPCMSFVNLPVLIGVYFPILGGGGGGGGGRGFGCLIIAYLFTFHLKKGVFFHN